MNAKKALKKIKAKVSGDFIKAPNPGLYFHNQEHTKNVVSRARKIGRHYELEEEPLFILLAAAWFHDIGYLYGKSAGHEHRSAELAGIYLASEGHDLSVIESVKNTITSATTNAEITAPLAQMLCDADVYHWGTKEFSEQNKLFRKELEWQLKEKIPKQEWISKTIEMLESHAFQTDFCQQKLEAGKQKNLQKWRDKLSKLTDENADNVVLPGHEKKS